MTATRATKITVTVVCSCGIEDEIEFEGDYMFATEISWRCQCGARIGVYSDGTINTYEDERQALDVADAYLAGES